MRNPLSFFAIIAFLLLNGCTKDISCYRDMIIGTWVELTFDNQEPVTNLRGTLQFDGKNWTCVVQRAQIEEDGSSVITATNMDYDVYCKLLYLDWNEFEILHFTDSTLRVKDLGDFSSTNEIAYKKVSKLNSYAQTIQNLWEVTMSDNSSILPFRMEFMADKSYHFYTINEDQIWEEKSDEEGKYEVFDTFLMTSFFNNPQFGLADKKGVACWDILFDQEEGKMIWSAIVDENGVSSKKSYTFMAVKSSEEDLS